MSDTLFLLLDVFNGSDGDKTKALSTRDWDGVEDIATDRILRWIVRVIDGEAEAVA